MTQKYLFRTYNKSLSDSTFIWKIWKDHLPFMPIPNAKAFHMMLQKRVEGLEDTCFITFSQEKAVAFSVCFTTAFPNTMRIFGVTLPAEQNKGIGQRLLQKTEQYAREKGIQNLHTMTFDSFPNAISFLTKAQFTVKDHLIWSSFLLNQKISTLALNKHQKVSASGIQFISGHQFSEMHEDWDYRWWEHICACLNDVPSEIPIRVPPFEKWRSLLEIPFCRRKNTIFAMDTNRLVGVLELGEPQNDISNINHSSVARSYRRRGISTALKVEAVRWGQRKNLVALHTQNHSNNPILKLNRDFGFVQQHCQYNMERVLDIPYSI